MTPVTGTEFLAGLVARARDAAPALTRRRPSLFEPLAQPTPPDPRLRTRPTYGAGTPGSEWSTGPDPLDPSVTTLVEAFGETDGTTASPRPARRRSRSAAPRPWDVEPSRRSGSEQDVEQEPPDADASSRSRAGRPHSAEAPVALRPAKPAAPATLPSQPPLRTSVARGIETIVEVPAPAPPPATPALELTSPLSGPDGRHRAAGEPATLVDDGTGTSPSGPTRASRRPSGDGRRAEEGAEAASVRPLRRPSPPAAGPQHGTFGRRNLPAITTPAPATPVIHVTIGRIEVRATPARTPAPVPAPRPSGPKLGLDEYLRSRSGRAG